ncbi:VOC family protein [Bacillus cytotoxicus]|uniref:Glyoxalase/fosfomycin resistance/dioxygenase domain-containing protein n=1 Tax=Bacillus cytotoxicus TaxID=580165 RepID=A0AAX2CD07_9BACI|nr:VOC family protein [Bacillus cytotoxicus]SCL85406.1 Uncharacterized protein BCB44BAC_00740 [Bacillus cytotoxicus]
MEQIINVVLLEVRNLKDTLYFYEGILGLKPSSERPQLDVTGVWYDVGPTRICIMTSKNRTHRTNEEQITPKEIRIAISDIEKVKKKLAFYQISFSEKHNPNGTVIIVHDPDQHELYIESKIS